MKFEETDIKGCFLIEADWIGDERGGFTRVFCAKEARPFIGPINFVQINHSFNTKKGTFRGLHYQVAPHAEGKLIRCLAGSVIDLVLDVRKNSPTFLKSMMIKLNAQSRRMIFIPQGCAHGFQTLEDNSELLYHHTGFYQKESERGIRFDDPRVRIKLPMEISSLSEKDKHHPLLDRSFNGIEL